MAVFKEAPVEPMTVAEKFGGLFETLEMGEVLIGVGVLGMVVLIMLAKRAMTPRRRRNPRADEIYGVPRADGMY